jgi:hypothetical protein
MWWKHMSTGYLGTATNPDLGALASRVARLERELERRDRDAADRRMWLGYCRYSALMAVGISVIVYLAASLG